MRKFISKLRYLLVLLLVVTTVSQVPIASAASKVIDKPGSGTVVPNIWLIEFE
ncbi:MAG: hypothetical protein K0S61_1724 [Anaerocolumna sp.]|jgi:hypothetical protein|nr:hypothetical protein [Anaerocolumna sp.]